MRSDLGTHTVDYFALLLNSLKGGAYAAVHYYQVRVYAYVAQRGLKIFVDARVARLRCYSHLRYVGCMTMNGKIISCSHLILV